MRTYYPLLLDLSGKCCLIVGGGKVAERKMRGLLAAGANVTVVSPEVTPTIARLAEEGRIRWIRRRYQEGDEAGAFLVYAATGSAEVNLRISRRVTDGNGLVNVADRPDLGNFIVPAAVRRGKLLLAVSTGGASPGLARKIREKLEEQYGAEYEAYLDFLAEARAIVRAQVPSERVRREIFCALLGDEYLQLARRGKKQRMYERLAELVALYGK
ncbi:bifunctional precorrin-2 dehydrogenase/sirohydrochlorin ferrochelatase [Bacillaceae bacterium]